MRTLVLLLIFWSLPTFAKVWNSTRQWDEAAEIEYSNWISQQGPELFRQLNIATDCADAVIGARWIFARTHQLPAANTIDTGSIFSSDSGQFDSMSSNTDLKKDERFRAALRYVFNNSSTKTLFIDGYPVSMTKKSLMPGAFYLRPGDEMGHAELVARVDTSGIGFPITFYASTVPGIVRDLLVYPFLQVRSPDADLQDGFRRFRWPVQLGSGIALKPSAEMPWYSKEQFQISTSLAFDEYVFQKMGLTFDNGLKLQALSVVLMDRFASRFQSVQEAVQKCTSKQKQCVPKSELYEDYSTPARDTSIVFLIAGMTELINSSGFRASEFQANLFDLEQTNVLEIQGRKLTLADLILIWNKAQYSSDPTVSELERWGLQ